MKIAFALYQLAGTERMSLMLLSALTKKHFPYAKRDMIVYKEGRFAEKLEKFKPDIVAISAMTGEHVDNLEMAKEIRLVEKRIGKKIFIIMGGPHCTFAPEVLRGSVLDAVGVGECDLAWVELLSAMEGNKNINYIFNIVTQENFSSVVKPASFGGENYIKYKAINVRERTCFDATHKSCLDDLPFFDWELHQNRTNFDSINPIGKRTIMTRRGCPFFCTYCFNRVFKEIYHGMGPALHNYSIDRIIEECKYVAKRWPTRFWKIYDDVFIFSSKGKEGARLREFAEKWPKEIGLPFFVLTRADLVAKDPDILRLLKEAGCCSLTMSIEGGNEYVREKVLERSMSDEEIIFAHRLAWELGIKTFSNVIFSVPIKDEEIIKYNLSKFSIDRDIESVDIAMKARVHYLECPMLAPYPGTKLGKYCQENGFFNGDIDKMPSSYQNTSIFDCFEPGEKRMSQNLAFLALWCVWLGSRQNYFVREVIAPKWFWLVTEFLIRLPWQWSTKAYFVMYFTLKQWLNPAEIYRIKNAHAFLISKESLKGIWPRLKFAISQQFPANK